MSILPNFLRSLVLTVFLCFIAPFAVIAVFLASLIGIGYVPGFESVGASGTTQLLQFLAVFGSGCPLQGIIVIGFACGLVGALFDTYSFYRYQMLNDN
ncbi:MAG: hypothetical protein WBG73_12275 [Coleofasciculaceae cyanobacterium]